MVGPELDADRVLHAGGELDVGPVQLAGPLPHPHEVRGGGVGQAGAGVDPGEGALVVEQQRLVAGEELDPAQRLEVRAARLHEPHRLVDLAGHDLVPGVRRVGREAAVPLVHLAQVGEAAGGEGADEVQRRGGRVVRPDQALRVVRARLLGELVGVDRVAAVRRQRDALAGLGVVAAGLGELPGHPAHLHHGQAAAVHEHDGHLEDRLHAAADGVGGRVGEGLGAVAALEQEGLAAGGRGQPVAQVVALAGEHERRVGAQLRGRGGQGVGAVPGRLLRRREVGPGQGHPPG